MRSLIIDLYSIPNIIWVILRRMRWVEHVVCTGERGGAYRVLVGKLRERDHLEDPGIDRIILRMIFRKWDGGGGMDWIDLAQDTDR